MLLIFANLDEKHNVLEILRKFSKVFENFLRKLQKNIMLAYFSKKFKNPCVNFLRVLTKTQFIGNFEKNFLKISLKIAKTALFKHYFKKFNNP